MLRVIHYNLERIKKEFGKKSDWNWILLKRYDSFFQNKYEKVNCFIRYKIKLTKVQTGTHT